MELVSRLVWFVDAVIVAVKAFTYSAVTDGTTICPVAGQDRFFRQS